MEVFEGDSSTNLADRPDEFYDIIYIMETTPSAVSSGTPPFQFES
jgi:hypothetical protein